MSMQSNEMNIKPAKEGSLHFVKEVARYFMDFLETNFHKRDAPRRNIKLHSEDNLLVGLSLGKYPTFSKRIWKRINESIAGDDVKVEKGDYKANIPNNLLELIKVQINKISNKTINKIISELEKKIKQNSISYKQDYTKAIEETTKDTTQIIRSTLILDLVGGIAKPLEKADLGDENTIYQMEEELSQILVRKIENSVTDILKLLISGERVDIGKELEAIFDLESIKADFATFFEMFGVADLFLDIFEMEKNLRLLDKNEFYLYFCDITFNKIKYPIFYIPLTVEIRKDELFINFDSQLYVNKKALNYIVQEYNKETGQGGTLKKAAERIIYIAEHETDLSSLLQEIVSEIVNFFGLDVKIDITKPIDQTSKNRYVKLTTNTYVALFDKADEALINDYEEILNLDEDNPLVTSFDTLIGNFVHKNLESVDGAVEDVWGDKSVSERLVFKSPIPLNSEQLKILSALGNENCEYVVVEGPPGTGKSHTITAILFHVIMQNKSVLVLSDKKEALDVVQEKIESSMDKVRFDKSFQNPILRLGRTGNTYRQILAQASVDGIKQHVHAVKNEFAKIEDDINNSVAGLQRDIDSQINAYKKIQIDDIAKCFAFERHFETTGCCIDLDEALRNPDSTSELPQLREIFKRFNSRLNKVKFNFDIAQSVTQDNLLNLVKMTETLRAIKSLLIDNPRWSRVALQYPKVVKLSRTSGEPSLLKEFLSIYSELRNLITAKSDIAELFDFDTIDISIIKECSSFVDRLIALSEIVAKAGHFAEDHSKYLQYFNEVSEKDVEILQQYIDIIKSLRISWFRPRRDKVEHYNKQFKKWFPLSSIDSPHRKIRELQHVLDIYNYILELEIDFPSEYLRTRDFLGFVIGVLKNRNRFYSQSDLTQLKVLKTRFDLIEDKLRKQEWFRKLNISSFEELHDAETTERFSQLCDDFYSIYNREQELLNPTGMLKVQGDIYDTLLTVDVDVLLSELTSYKEAVGEVVSSMEDINYLNAHLARYPLSMEKVGVELKSFSTLCENQLIGIPDAEFEKIINYLNLRRRLQGYFDEIKPLYYGDRKDNIEERVTALMTYLMDKRFIHFVDNFRADARAFRNIITNKRKFPRNEFAKLKEAFPCILAGIRDYAEYIPLEPEIFDLVIIDEASQVSIAQAFPALLRAKKVVVLGDSRQFSNVKSAQARTDINKEYVNSLKNVFVKNISQEPVKLVKLEKFNIKVSILDFFEFITNYKCRLMKHFRGYKECISYSNKNFYNDSLQVMKIRGKPIYEVLKFSVLKHDGKKEVIANTNSLEIDCIISELDSLREKGLTPSVGIITPHTNQQKLISKRINELPEKDYYFDELKLKIMTFDTCQGDERDIIFYSMVATEEDDKLGYIFIKDLNNVDIEEEGKIKAQRLNVGFSRAKECMHFVLSKPLEKYSGAIGEALRHYHFVKEKALKEKDVALVDPRSKMEPHVLNWFYQTKFWKENEGNVELFPQFEFGKYLKQLDRTYNHPKYKVDFLLVYNDKEGDHHKVVIEYDGLEEHFKNAEGVNEYNYRNYYSEEDLYREKVIEGYGYKFLRINKFNVGENPIETLDNRLRGIFKKKLLKMTH